MPSPFRFKPFILLNKPHASNKSVAMAQTSLFAAVQSFEHLRWQHRKALVAPSGKGTASTTWGDDAQPASPVETLPEADQVASLSGGTGGSFNSRHFPALAVKMQPQSSIQIETSESEDHPLQTPHPKLTPDQMDTQEVPPGQLAPDRTGEVELEGVKRFPTTWLDGPTNPEVARQERLLEGVYANIHGDGIKAEPMPADEMEEDDAIDEVLVAASGVGFRFKVNSPMGKRWNRYLEKQLEMKADYDSKRRNEKEDIRALWAKGEFENYKKQRMEKQGQTDLDRRRGRFCNIDAIIKAEGGHHSGAVVEGSMEIARECLRRGKEWVRVNEFSKRLEFRYMTDEMETTNWHSWSLKELETLKPMPAVPAPPAPPAPAFPQSAPLQEMPAQEMPAQEMPVQEVAPKAKAKASAKRAREGSPGEPKAKAKAGAGQRRAGSAGKMKTDEQKLKEMLVEYGKVSTQANTIIAKVTGGHD